MPARQCVNLYLTDRCVFSVKRTKRLSRSTTCWRIARTRCETLSTMTTMTSTKVASGRLDADVRGDPGASAGNGWQSDVDSGREVDRRRAAGASTAMMTALNGEEEDLHCWRRLLEWSLNCRWLKTAWTVTAYAANSLSANSKLLAVNDCRPENVHKNRKLV